MDLVNGLEDYDKKRFADPYGNGIERFDKLTKYVDMAIKGLGNNTASAIDVAAALYYIREEKLYESYPVPGADGLVFKDFNSFCKMVFRCGKSTIYNYIALYERFGSDSEIKTVAIPSKCIKSYTYSQLLLMTSLSDAELLNIKPDWSCQDIKNYVKEKKGLNSKRLEKEVEEKDNISTLSLIALVKEQYVRYVEESEFKNRNLDFYYGYLKGLEWVLSFCLHLDTIADKDIRSYLERFLSNYNQ